MNTLAMITAFALLLASRPDGFGKVNNSAAALAGEWTCLAAVINGKALSDTAVKKLRLTMTRDRYKTERSDEVLFDSTYRLDDTRTPNQITLLGTEGDLIGKEALGIVSLSDDILIICYVMPGQPRPISFQSSPGSEAYLVVWKRR